MAASTGPLVSIGLPVYNGGQGVARAIESLLGQDYRHIELIISDNASTDGTDEICQAYARQDDRVKYSRNATNIGANGNFNRVLRLAQGRYFMFAAADDAWAPRFVSALLSELKRRPAAAVAMSAVQRVEEDGTPIDILRFRTETGRLANELSSFEIFKRIQYGEGLYIYLYGLYKTAFLRRAMGELLPEVPSMDVHLMAEIALTTRFGYVDEPLYIRTINQTPAYKRYPGEKYARLARDGVWTPEAERAFLREYIWASRLVPLHRKVLALAWLRCRDWDLRRLPGGGLLHWLNRALSRQVG